MRATGRMLKIPSPLLEKSRSLTKRCELANRSCLRGETTPNGQFEGNPTSESETYLMRPSTSSFEGDLRDDSRVQLDSKIKLDGIKKSKIPVLEALLKVASVGLPSGIDRCET